MDGVLNIYKPLGLTSFDVVRIVRKISNTKKVGHAGTLDPEASGVLPVCLGRGTKIIEYIMENVKVYNVELKLGVVTDTYDREGKVISNKDVNLDDYDIINTIMSFVGESYQIPPMYSALKVNGQRLYDLARNGVEVERTPRKINIYNIKIEKIEKPCVNFSVTCSKGTYIRSLCFDIGEKLGCGGMMNQLERYATGRFNIKEAVNIYDLNEENISDFLITLDDALDELDKITVDEKFEKLLLNGVNIKDPGLLGKIEANRLMRVYNISGLLIGIGNKDKGTFKIVKLLV